MFFQGMFLLKALYWGQHGARENFARQITTIVEHGYKSLGEVPVVIGECGVPMDLNKKDAFGTNDFIWQARMMDAMITGLERAMVGYTLWNYNPSNDDGRGDDWNGENFSWFSRKRALPHFLLYHEQSSPSLDQGGRILEAVVRPYPAKTAGVPLKFDYEMNTGAFIFDWANPSSTTTKEQPPATRSISPPLSGHPELSAWETELFVPSMIASGRKIIVHGLSEGDTHAYDENRQTLFVVVRDRTPGRTHRLQVAFDPPLSPTFEVNTVYSDNKHRIFAIVGMMVCALAWWVNWRLEEAKKVE